MGRRGSDSVATSGLSNPPIQQRQRLCHLSAEALLPLSCSHRHAAPAGAGVGGWGEGWVPGAEAGAEGRLRAPPRNAPGALGVCAPPTGPQGAPPAHSAEGEAETPRD